ncbi:MAG: PorT family protein [Bacteroidetes bacterium]|nr:PorT family protein [Bacteroidota bacterium]
MRRLLATILFLVSASYALADPPGEDVQRPHFESPGMWYLQFDLGVNISFLNGNPAFRQLTASENPTDLFNSASGLGPLFGVTVGYAFSDRFALSLGLDFDSRYVSRSADVVDPCPMINAVTGDTTLGTTTERKSYDVLASYVSLPLMANFRFGKAFVFLGPTFSIPIRHRVTETDRILDSASACYLLFGTPDSTKELDGALDNNANLASRVSLKLGAGYTFELTKKISLVPQIAYDIGFSDLLKANEQDVFHSKATGTAFNGDIINGAMRLSALQLSLGLRINL